MIDWHDDKTKVRQWATLLNDLFGIISFTLAITALLSPYPSEIATFSIIFITLWALAKGRPFRKPIQRYEDKNGSVKTNLILFGGSYVFIAGLFSLVLVACGFITMETLVGMSFESWIFK